MRSNSWCGGDGFDDLDDLFDEAIAVAPLVVVPGHDLD